MSGCHATIRYDSATDRRHGSDGRAVACPFPLQDRGSVEIVIAGGMKIFGDRPLGWRLCSAVCGSVTLVAIFLWTYLLLRDFDLSLLAATLTLFNNFLLVMGTLAGEPYAQRALVSVVLSRVPGTRTFLPDRKLRGGVAVAPGCGTRLTLSPLESCVGEAGSLRSHGNCTRSRIRPDGIVIGCAE